MIKKTAFRISEELLDVAQCSVPDFDFRVAINQPTGNFFYDSWEISPEFENTVWHELLNTLPYSKGQARLICLKSGTCYQSHADIDDRYHLNISGSYSHLINLDTKKTYKIDHDRWWYDMDAGSRHSAANFGFDDRIQLVVRKLLIKTSLINPIKIKIKSRYSADRSRFMFDDTISPWLNYANKAGIISNFSHEATCAVFDVEEDCIDELSKIIPEGFNIENVGKVDNSL
jgi:hypothetical protein